MTFIEAAVAITVRAASPSSLPAGLLRQILADNPLRQRLTGTPFALVARPDRA
ncbi:MAG: hypothetical protein M3Q87_04445 [Actinomycetota bacterium]|nr:hypothetical protein [Actinomycetota bacterium]